MPAQVASLIDVLSLGYNIEYRKRFKFSLSEREISVSMLEIKRGSWMPLRRGTMEEEAVEFFQSL